MYYFVAGTTEWHWSEQVRYPNSA